MSDYSEAWADYKRLRNQALIALFSFFAVLILVSALLNRVSSQRVGDYLHAAFGVTWILSVLVTGARVESWPCPRCGKLFAGKWWYRRSILLAGSCAHCGLRKYAQG